jgi:hypothetical protein
MEVSFLSILSTEAHLNRTGTTNIIESTTNPNLSGGSGVQADRKERLGEPGRVARQERLSEPASRRPLPAGEISFFSMSFFYSIYQCLCFSCFS